MQKIKKIIPIALAFAPSLVFARTISSIISDTIRPIIDTLVPLFIAVAVAVFLYGVVKYVTSAGDEEKRKEAKSYMLYGIIGLFVMVSIWGLVTIISDTFALDSNVTVPTTALPQ